MSVSWLASTMPTAFRSAPPGNLRTMKSAAWPAPVKAGRQPIMPPIAERQAFQICCDMFPKGQCYADNIELRYSSNIAHNETRHERVKAAPGLAPASGKFL